MSPILVGTGVGHQEIWLPEATLGSRSGLAVGHPGSGKTSAAIGLSMQFVLAGGGCVAVDAKGEYAGELASTWIPALHRRISPEDVTVLRLGSSRYGVGLDPCVPIEGMPIEVQADIVAQRVLGLADSLESVRVRGALFHFLVGAIARGGNLADVLKMARDDRFRAAFAEGVPQAEARRYLKEGYANEGASTKGALEARLAFILRLPQVRAALCARRRLPNDALVPRRGFTVIDLSNEFGSNELLEVVGGLVLLQVVAAVFARRSGANAWHREKPPPCLLVLDECQRYISLDVGLAERLVTEARAFGVGVLFLTQSIHHRAFDPALRDLILRTLAYSLHFRPTGEDLRDVRDLLPVTGRRIDPRRPDRLLDERAELDLLTRELTRLAPREALFVNHEERRAELVRTAELDYDQARERAGRVNPLLREVYERGRYGVPLPELLAAAQPSDIVVREETAEAPAEAPAAARGGRTSRRPKISLVW